MLEVSGVNPADCDALYMGPEWPDRWPGYVEESLPAGVCTWAAVRAPAAGY
ncbi:MAG: hypothetical protein NTW02_11075 [Cyanobium sp. LacPavin_0920_WC12_MAG_62_9]|nr:hypothetical protein [Cyanobium sp. LacPavin_0920_WC12_MAG_62_9]